MTGCDTRTKTCECGTLFPMSSRSKKCEPCRVLRTRQRHNERTKERRRERGLALRAVSYESNCAIERKLALLDAIRRRLHQNDRWNPYAPVRQMSHEADRTCS